MIRAVVFDLEGTVIDVEELHWLGHVQTANEFGLPLTLRDAPSSIPSFVGGPDDAIAKEIADRAPRRPPWHAVLDRTQYLFEQALGDMTHVPARKNFERVLDRLVGSSVPVAIASVTDGRLVKRLLALGRIDDRFPENLVLCRESVSKPKPAPDIYMEAVRRLGFSAAETMVLEDSPGGVRAGKGAGCFVVAVPSRMDPVLGQRLRDAGADVVVNDWFEVELLPELPVRNVKDGSTPLAVTVLLEEFRALRAEVVLCLERRVTILSYGLAAIGVLLGGVAASQTASSPSVLAGAVLSGVAAHVCQFVLVIWLSETRRVRRASQFLYGVELRINAWLPRGIGGMSWESGIRSSDADHPQTLFSDHYNWVIRFFLTLSLGATVLSLYLAYRAMVGVNLLGPTSTRATVWLAFALLFARWCHRWVDAHEQARWLEKNYNRRAQAGLVNLPACVDQSLRIQVTGTCIVVCAAVAGLLFGR